MDLDDLVTPLIVVTPESTHKVQLSPCPDFDSVLCRKFSGRGLL